MASTTVAPEILDKLFNEELHRYELVDGGLRSKPMVSIFHGLLLSWLSHLLHVRLTALGKSEELWVLADPLPKFAKTTGTDPISPLSKPPTPNPGNM
jgi:hypothetical protein